MLPSIPQGRQLGASQGPRRGIQPEKSVRMSADQFRRFDANGSDRFARRETEPADDGSLPITKRGNITGRSLSPRQKQVGRRHYEPAQVRATTPLSRPNRVMTFGDYKSYLKTTIDPVLLTLTTALYLHKPINAVAFMCNHLRGTDGDDSKDNDDSTDLSGLEARQKQPRLLTPKYNGPDRVDPKLRPPTFMELRAKALKIELENAKIADAIASESPAFSRELENREIEEKIRFDRLYGDEGNPGPLDAMWIRQYANYSIFLREVVRPILRDVAASLFEQKPADPIEFLIEHLQTIQMEAPAPRMLQPNGRGTTEGAAVTLDKMAAKVGRLQARRIQLRKRQRMENVKRVKRQALQASRNRPLLSEEEASVKIQSRYRATKGRADADLQKRRVAYQEQLAVQSEVAESRHQERMRERRRQLGMVTEEDKAFEEAEFQKKVEEVKAERAAREERSKKRILKQAKNRWKKAGGALIGLQSLARRKLAKKRVDHLVQLKMEN
eukprot:g6446.t1